jgi:acetylornithine/succinyldiaminopimelate/putrescine aminotransferase
VALSATPQESKQAPFAPLVPGFQVVPKDPEALAAAVDADTAAVLLEPIQGETGIHPLSEDLLRAAQQACDRTGAALIFDEIQTGMGRTGTLWAYEQTGVVPDAMTSAKALGGGLPIGALITGPRLADVFQPGDHGSTFAGGPLVASAALVAVEICSDPELLASVRTLGERLYEGLASLPAIARVRGRGLMIGVDLQDGVSAPELAQRALLEQRLILNATGPATIRFEPPLVVSESEIDEALARLGELTR